MINGLGVRESPRQQVQCFTQARCLPSTNPLILGVVARVKAACAQPASHVFTANEIPALVSRLGAVSALRPSGSTAVRLTRLEFQSVAIACSKHRPCRAAEILNEVFMGLTSLMTTLRRLRGPHSPSCHQAGTRSATRFIQRCMGAGMCLELPPDSDRRRLIPPPAP